MKLRPEPATPPTARPAGAAFLDRHAPLLVWGLVALYVAVYFSVCVTKFRYYLYTDFDLALFTQAAHQILRGSLDNSIRGMNWLGDHSSLALFLVAPLQVVWPGPLSLLFVQTLSLALGGWAAWRLARHEGLAEPAPLIFAALYLLYPAIGYVNLFEFHPEALSTSALLFAFLYLRTGSRRAMLLWAGLALLGKEDVALPVFMMGLYALTLRRTGGRIDAAALAGLAVLSLALSFGVLKPALNEGDVDYGDMYRALGDTTFERVLYVFTHPAEVVAALFTTPGDPASTTIKLNWHLHMLAPLLFLPLLSPLALMIAGPTLAEHMLSNRSPQHSIVFQYTALIAPIVVASAVLGAKQLAAWLGRRGTPKPGRAKRARAAPPRATLDAAIAAAALVGSIATSFAFGPLWGDHARMPVRPFEAHRPDAIDRTQRPIRDAMLARVPATGGVVASFRYMPRLATRAAVHSVHHVIRGRYTYSQRLFPIPTGVSALIADMGDPTLVPYQGPTSADRMQELLARNALRPVAAVGDHVLFLGGARDTVELCTPYAPAPGVAREVVFDGELAMAGIDSVVADAMPGGEVGFHTHWRRIGAANALYLMDVMLVDTSGKARVRHTRPLGSGIYPVNRWPLGAVVREVGRLLVPLDTPPGEYVLAFGLRRRDGRRREPPAAESIADPGVVRLGTVRVAAGGR